MAVTVACLTHPGASRYQKIADAMAAGIAKHGDRVKQVVHSEPACADVAIMYGWKLNASLQKYPNFIYADLGYWNRDSYYRFSVNGWSPESYVRSVLGSERFESLGLEIAPWNELGDRVIVAGSSRKAAREHGFEYMQWETKACNELSAMGLNVWYRPKPNDLEKRPIAGISYDESNIKEAFLSAKALVTHHSNTAIDALLAGVPVHCETGAAAAFSVPLDLLETRLEGREQFLHDVAWLQWSLEEMRSGEAWAHLRGLVC